MLSPGKRPRTIFFEDDANCPIWTIAVARTRRHIAGMTETIPTVALLFSYGTLRQPEVQHALFGRSLEGTPDAMPGWRSRMIEITDAEVIAKSGTRWHPMVERSDDPADAVEGLVFRLTPADLAAADAYEVDYVRREITLRSGVSAFVYADPEEQAREAS